MSDPTTPGEPRETADAAIRTDRSHPNWFELFFDLVFVATVYLLAHELHGDPQPVEFGEFFVLFFPAWWAWVNLTMTVNIFGPGNWRAQATLVASMPGIGLMAASVPDGLGDRAWVYALGAAWVRLAYLPLWWRPAWSADSPLPLWRPLLYGLLPATLWAVSAATPGTARFVLWGLAVGLEVALLSVRAGGTRASFNELAVGHLVERISLFVVIVLGESVLTIVTTLADHFTFISAGAALAAFVAITALAMAFYLWGTPTAALGLNHAARAGASQALRDAVMYLPFLLVSGITAIAASLDTTVADPHHTLPPGARWALCGGLLLFFTASAALSLRHGDRLGTALQWYVPCLLALGVLFPATWFMPSWAAVTSAAVLLVLLVVLGQRRVLYPESQIVAFE
ncbi:low temperature requirement protein A [Streptomyces sp. CA-251247]|uniref:low temperature requirement protein A n=1 Tax=Streptomyces sp. CA-251247 TaxID=3240062 RepID=UPI003D8DF66E